MTCAWCRYRSQLGDVLRVSDAAGEKGKKHNKRTRSACKHIKTAKLCRHAPVVNCAAVGILKGNGLSLLQC